MAKKSSNSHTWDELENFVVDKYSKLKIKANEFTAKTAGLRMANWRRQNVLELDKNADKCPDGWASCKKCD